MLRAAGTLLVGGLCLAYILWKIDVRQTAHILGNADLVDVALAVAITIGAVFPLTWRWQKLLAARDVHESFWWLTRTSFTSSAIAQVLPTSLGGDATRIFYTARRHPGAGSAVAGSVLLERVLGGFATLLLAAIGFALAIGRYDVGPYLWVEAAILAASVAGLFAVFSTRARTPMAYLARPLRLVRLERPLRTAYQGVHGYRTHGRLLVWSFVLTTFVQAFRVLAIWLVARAVGVHLSPRPFYVLGPLLFLVMIVPFTVNGLALREAFFVSFLGKLHVPADPAFATGFLFYLLSLASGIPGAVLLLTGAVPARRKDMGTEIRT
ncbi:MAG TPA: lysylphosphatidylglycerol synthase transmembrane domain-containing protein [Gaiellaceae bacterium]|nr:lysylphosphatidylglycerol synthase transmembrane domain-containing protein [Gaiellaceae bacterium]